jgi:hypothetical protein
MSLTSELFNIIKNSTSTKLITNLRSGSLASSKDSGDNYIPPNNSLLVNTLPKRPRRLAAPKSGVTRDDKIPKIFTWKGNELLGPVKHQHKCGSCWAFAASGMFSDVISIKTKGKQRPDLSETYLLSCRPQVGCGGGIPSEAVKDLVQYGIVKSDCVDYSWCKKNGVCSGSALEHFDNPADYLNSKIPPCLSCKKEPYVIEGITVSPVSEKNFPDCKKVDLEYVRCVKGGGTVKKYYGKNAFSIFAETDSSGNVKGDQLAEVHYDMKEHIINKGPILGQYFVLNNFIQESSGKFSATNGIYMENFQYKDTNGSLISEDNSDMSFNTTPFAISGGHAVVIVGYGEMDVKAINPETELPYGNVKFWDVRNSWGTEWGNKGFFRMAQYPINKFSQFDVGLDTGTDGNGDTIWFGGASLLEFDRSESVKVLNNKLTVNMDENDDLNYVKPTKDLVKAKSSSGGNMNRNIIIVVILLLFLLLVGVYVYKNMLGTNN